ncbi:MAG: hypothetical protein ACLUE2_10525 [Bacteroides cellulosilyticus]
MDEDAPDTAPVEDEENGLNLNWASNHFYWGYYHGHGIRHQGL